MKVLFDTNILLDVLLKREGLFQSSARAWSLVATQNMRGYISAISVNNLYYIVKKLKDKETAERFVEQILSDFGIVSLTESIIRRTHAVASADFEDMIQYYSAIRTKCSVLLTRNTSDFPKNDLEIMTPEEFFERTLWKAQSK